MNPFLRPVDRELGNVAHWNLDASFHRLLFQSWQGVGQCRPLKLCDWTFCPYNVDRELGNVAHWNPAFFSKWIWVNCWQGVGQCRPLKQSKTYSLLEPLGWQGVGQCRPLKRSSDANVTENCWQGVGQCRPLKLCFSFGFCFSFGWQGVGQSRPLKLLISSCSALPFVDRELGKVAHWYGTSGRASIGELTGRWAIFCLNQNLRNLRIFRINE